MMLYDVIVVGSGPAGTSAVYRLQGKNMLVLDVGYEPENKGQLLNKNLYELKKSGQGLFDEIIGPNFESLHNIDKNYLSPKLKAPLLRYVIRNWRSLSPVISDNFDPVMSFAKGGLANAWGGGAYRFTSDEIMDFPISSEELHPYYEELTAHLGISGQSDDLERYFGSTEGLLPPIELNNIGRDMLQKYMRHKKFFHRHNIFIGYPRIAVLTRHHDGREMYSYDGLEFFKPYISSIYNPAYTMQKLIAKKAVDYLAEHLVVKYEERYDVVHVYAKNLKSDSIEIFYAKKLILGAGSLNTARIVLQSKNDFETKLPLLDNLISYIPLCNMRRIGSSVEKSSVPAQLNLIYDGELFKEPIQATVYGMMATLWTDFLFDFPLSAKDCISAVKYLLPSMLIIQLFYPDRTRSSNYLKLETNGHFKLHYELRQRGLLESHLIRVFRRVGYFGLPALCKYPPPGNSFHYAGSLPMRDDPGPYETDRNGRLAGTRNVHIVDAANFSALPSKNLTFTIMANAMRIADKVKGDLDRV